jgi:hypothetical protein
MKTRFQFNLYFGKQIDHRMVRFFVWAKFRSFLDDIIEKLKIKIKI